MLEIICVWGISKSGVALRILGVAPEVGEKAGVLRVGENSASARAWNGHCELGGQMDFGGKR